jgi:hypothetical protein
LGVEIPAAESLESPKAENEILWKKATDQTGAAYSGKNTFKSGEGEFAVVHQGDSFAGSHAYMLLSDVPGASANSGATITSKDSKGNQAFVAAETRGTTEQEVAAGAGSQFKTVIDQAGKSEFPQLPENAKVKILFGRIGKAGGKEHGSAGWTSEKIGTGQYKIKISPALSAKAVPTVTGDSTAGQRWDKCSSSSTTEVVIEFFNSGFLNEDSGFYFQIMG